MFVIYSGGLCKVMHLYVWILLTYISGVGFILNVLAYLCTFEQDSLGALSNEEYQEINLCSLLKISLAKQNTQSNV